MASATQRNDMDKAGPLGVRSTAVVLAVIIALGIGLRIHRIGAESVWWDEYASLMHLGAPDLWTFLKLNRTLDPATLPLYYSLEYLWSHHVSDSIPGLRLLSIFIGTLVIPLLYVFGRDLYGKGAGLTAALCVAMSPIHIHHAQGIRMYVLLTLLALLSAYTFMKVLRDGRERWWGAHVLSNLLLVWTHPFGLLPLVVEGCSLVVTRYRPFQRTAAWIGVHVVLLVPSALYLSRVRFWSAEGTATWLRMPSVAEFLGDVFADDVISVTYQLRDADTAWAGLPLRPILDAALVFALCAGVAWLGMRAWRKGRSNSASRSRGVAVFLLMWLVLPPLALYVLSMLRRPCIFPRYTVHSSLALYLMVGGAVASLPRKAMRAAAVCALVVLYGYQLSLLYPGPQRTDWRSAGAFIRSRGSPNDPILVQASIWQEVFSFNLGPAENPVSSTETLEVLADQADFLLNYCKEPSEPENPLNRAWLVVKLPYFESGPSRELEAELTSLGLEFAITEFGGIQHVLVYEVTRDPARGPLGHGARKSIPATADFIEDYGNLATALAHKGHFDCATAAINVILYANSYYVRTYGNLLAAIEKQQNVEAIADAVDALRKGYGYRANGRLDFAIAEFQKATELDPDYAIANAELGTALAERGDYDAALPALEKAMAMDATYAMTYRNVASAIAKRGRVEACLEAVETLFAANGLQQKGELDAALDAFRRAIELDPDYALAYASLGAGMFAKGDVQGSRRVMRKAFAVDREFARTFEPFFVAFFETRNYDAAWAEVKRLREMNILVPPPVLEQLERASGRTE